MEKKICSYETLFAVSGNLVEEDAKAVIEKFVALINENVISFSNIVDRICESLLTPLVNTYIGSVVVNKVYKLLAYSLVLLFGIVAADSEECFVRTNLLFHLIFTSFWSFGHLLGGKELDAFVQTTERL